MSSRGNVVDFEWERRAITAAREDEEPRRFGRGMKRTAFVVAASLLLAIFAFSYVGFLMR
jgi:hypothetical protein